MAQTIGPKEQALREQREKLAGGTKAKRKQRPPPEPKRPKRAPKGQRGRIKR